MPPPEKKAVRPVERYLQCLACGHFGEHYLSAVQTLDGGVIGIIRKCSVCGFRQRLKPASEGQET